MANTIITPSVIANEALMQLENNLVMGKLVHREYKREFVKVGDSVSIRKPVKFGVSDGAARVNQDVQEASTPFTVDKRKHVSWKFSTHDLTMKVEEYSERYITPAMIALANQVDSDLTNLHKRVASHVGTAGTTPSSFLNFGSAGRRLDQMACPTDSRRLVLDPEASLYAADMLKGVYNPGIVSGALRGRTVGQLAGFDTYMDQNIKRHTKGAGWGSSPTVNGGSQSVTYATAGHSYGSTSQTLNITGNTTASQINEGDRFTIAGVFSVNPVSKESTGVLQEFVVLANATTTVTSGAATITISPAIITSGPFQTVDAAPASGAAITAAGSHTANLAFHKNAFGLVTCPLEEPDGAAWSKRQSANGLSVRVVKDYDIDTDDEVIRIDILYGVKALYPELACVLLG
jgi:hypothetical protein